MPEDFSDISNKSLGALLQNFVHIVEVLKEELPFDYLTPEWHIEDGTDNFMVGIRGRCGDRFYSLTVWTHYLDSPPKPQEMYPDNCCAVATLEVIGPTTEPRIGLEICGTPERWLVHHHDKWMPLSASYVAFLLGISQKLNSEKGADPGGS